MSVKAGSTILADLRIEIERYKTSVFNHCEEYIGLLLTHIMQNLYRCKRVVERQNHYSESLSYALTTHANPLKPPHKRHGQRIPHLCRYIYIKKSLTCRLFDLSRLRWLIHKARHLIDHEAWHLSFPHTGAQRRLKLSLFPQRLELSI